MKGAVRRCTPEDTPAIVEIVNDAARKYRGAIPDDRWHEPYMPEAELRSEIAAGVEFWGWDDGGRLLVGTWAAAEWAIDFYRRHGFRLVGPEEKDRLLSTYWRIPDRQREVSVVLVHEPHAG